MTEQEVDKKIDEIESGPLPDDLGFDEFDRPSRETCKRFRVMLATARSTPGWIEPDFLCIDCGSSQAIFAEWPGHGPTIYVGGPDGDHLLWWEGAELLDVENEAVTALEVAKRVVQTCGRSAA